MNIIKYTCPPIVIGLIIFYLSCVIAPSDVPPVDLGLPIETDKIIHFLMYFGLAGIASFNYIFLNNGKIIILKMLIFAILLPIIYGGIIELLQTHFFDRDGEWWDFIANSLGAISIIPFSLCFRRSLLNKELVNSF